jgi:hypothetical protein
MRGRLGRRRVVGLSLVVLVSLFCGGKTGPRCVPLEPTAPVWTFVEFTLETSGGFTGQGTLDVDHHGWSVTAHAPFGHPSTCTTLMQSEWLDQLLAAADAVDWTGIRSSYVPGDNPDCCCDQFVYDLTVTLTDADGGARTVTTRWCDQSLSEALVPDGLLSFVAAVESAGRGALAFCDGS